jgi:hypothetical protein
MALTEIVIRQAKPKEKTYMLSDGYNGPQKSDKNLREMKI